MKVEIKDKKGKDATVEFLLLGFSTITHEIDDMKSVLLFHDILFILLTIGFLLNLFTK